MASRIVVRVERGGKLLGSWALGEEPLRMSLVDLATGRQLAQFQATGEATPDAGFDEVPFALARFEDDDFTLPLPEPSRSLSTGGPTHEQLRAPAPVRNLAEPEGDGLTGWLQPDDESTVTRRVPEPTPAPARPQRPNPAEVWTQKRGEWRNLGPLIPGQRVSTLGGWVRLSPDGRLIVSSGQSLSGSATLLDGRMIPVEAGREPLALPAGSSVMLASGDRGLYVRSEPLPG